MTNDNFLPIGFLGVALALSGTAVASAQDNVVLGKGSANADRNGTITADEIDLARAALIAGADANGNRAISLDEYTTIFVELMRDHIVDGLRHADDDAEAQLSRLLDGIDGSVIDADYYERPKRTSDTQSAPAPFGADHVAAKLHQLSAYDGDKTCAALSDLSGGSRG